MRTEFNASGIVHLNADELKQKRELLIEKDKVQRALQQQKNNRRPQDEYDARNRLLQEHPRPGYKPEGVRTPRPDFDRLAKIEVAAVYAAEEKAALKPFDDKIAAIEAASRERQGLPPVQPKEEAAPAGPSDDSDRLQPETITDAYVQHVEALTEQENQRQASPEENPYPLSWPDERQSLIDAARAEADAARIHEHERD